jgi:prenyltransferase beta subunit
MGKRKARRSKDDGERDQRLRVRAVAIAALLPDDEADAARVLDYVVTIRTFCGRGQALRVEAADVIPFPRADR